MKKIKVRKSRHKNKPYFCGGCMSWNCDPMTRSPYMTAKMERRREEHVHFACGQRECTCKSKSNLKEAVWK